MSTELKPVKRSNGKEFNLTQFLHRQKGVCLQVTQGYALSAHEAGFIQVTREEALRLAASLVTWAAGDAETIEEG